MADKYFEGVEVSDIMQMSNGELLIKFRELAEGLNNLDFDKISKAELLYISKLGVYLALCFMEELYIEDSTSQEKHTL